MLPVQATLAGQSADVLYAGPQGAFPGLDQVNVRLPRLLAGKGLIDLAVAVENQVSNTVTLSIR